MAAAHAGLSGSGCAGRRVPGAISPGEWACWISTSSLEIHATLFAHSTICRSAVFFLWRGGGVLLPRQCTTTERPGHTNFQRQTLRQLLRAHPFVHRSNKQGKGKFYPAVQRPDSTVDDYTTRLERVRLGGMVAAHGVVTLSYSAGGSTHIAQWSGKGAGRLESISPV